MTTTSQKIEKALSILNGHDWYWMMSETNKAYGYAHSSMRAFVELVATIENSTIVKALRELWKVNYEYIHATMWCSNEAAKAEFKAKEAELMSIINPTFTMAA